MLVSHAGVLVWKAEIAALKLFWNVKVGPDIAAEFWAITFEALKLCFVLLEMEKVS